MAIPAVPNPNPISEAAPSPRALSLQPLTEADLPLALALDRNCLGGLWSEAGYRREIESDRSELWILTTGEPVPPARPPLQNPPPEPSQPGRTILALGCLWAILDEAHITLLAVSPQWRRQGLGQYLLWALLQAAYHRQLAWAALEVRVSNAIAIDLYRSFGFQAIGQRCKYYQDNQEDAAILWLKQLQSEAVYQSLQAKAPLLHRRLHQSGWQTPTPSASVKQYFQKS
ncbi:MAG: GNAT family N-acetyltransferase [Synechococcales cyanobacterium RM1_1_8]|nr:GNAT family N-acetyltransferase [Synechococcales cyanobacterium RM1_1_8]